MQTEIRQEAIKATPPAAVTAWTFLAELPLEKWVLLATLVYTALQIFFLLKREWKGRKRK